MAKKDYDPKVEKNLKRGKLEDNLKMFKDLEKCEGWQYYKKMLIEKIRVAKDMLVKLELHTNIKSEMADKLIIFEQENELSFNRRLARMQQFIRDTEVFISDPNRFKKEAQEVLENKEKKGGG